MPATSVITIAMSEKTKELAQQAQNLGKTTTGDHVESIVKAALSAVPVVGGPISSLISDYIPASRVHRLEEFTKDLAAEMERVSENLDADYVKTEEFAYLFVRVYQNVTRDYQKEKLDAYRNILINSLKPTNIPASIRERYLVVVEQLTAMHLYVLSAFLSDHRIAQIFAQKPNMMTGSIQQTLQIVLPGLSQADIQQCILDLDQMGVTNGVRNGLATMMTMHGAMQIETRLTTFGHGFIRFISAC